MFKRRAEIVIPFYWLMVMRDQLLNHRFHWAI